MVSAIQLTAAMHAEYRIYMNTTSGSENRRFQARIYFGVSITGISGFSEMNVR